MEALILKGSSKTPTIEFNNNTGVLLLKGRSIPENSIEFYAPLNTWIEEYSGNPSGKTVLEMRLEYFNTSSSKCILDVFKKLEKLKLGMLTTKKTTVTVMILYLLIKVMVFTIINFLLQMQIVLRLIIKFFTESVSICDRILPRLSMLPKQEIQGLM